MSTVLKTIRGDARSMAFVLALLLLCSATAAWADVSVTFIEPANGATYPENANIRLEAIADATQGFTISKVEFFHGGSLIGTDTQPYPFNGNSFSIWWDSAQTGNHVLTAKATAVKNGNPDQTATSAVVNVTVNDSPGVVMTGAPPVNTIYTLPAPDFPLSVTVTNTVGTISRVEFRGCSGWWSGELFATLTSPPYDFVWTLQPPYWLVWESEIHYLSFGIIADVWDSFGDYGTSGCKWVLVTPGVELTSPANEASFTAPATINVSAVLTPPDAPIYKMEFYNGTTLIGEDSSAPYSFSWQSVPIGTYSLTARPVYGGSEWQAKSSPPVSVTVTATSAQPQLHFIHVDHLNTPRLVADATGTTVWRWDQDEPFGNNPADEDPDVNSVAFDLPLRLPGQRYDKETNLHYNYFRDYDPSIGRYGESDPIGLYDDINTYAYVRGNPLSYSDPLGLQVAPGGAGAGGLGGFGSGFGGLGGFGGKGLGGRSSNSTGSRELDEALGGPSTSSSSSESDPYDVVPTKDDCIAAWEQTRDFVCAKLKTRAARQQCYKNAADELADCLKKCK